MQGVVEYREFPGLGEFYGEVIRRIRYNLSRPAGNPAAIMLPGGTTPKPIYDRLAADPPEISGQAVIILSDERMVPDGAPAQNYGQIAPVVRALGLSDERVIRVNTALPLK